MRPTRTIILIGSAVAVAGLLLPSLAADGVLVEAGTGSAVPWIWATLAKWQQLCVGGAAALGLLAAAFAVGRRVVAGIVALAAAGSAVVVGFVWSDTASAAAALADRLDAPVEAGLGHVISVAGLVALALGATWRAARAPRPAHPGDAGGPEDEAAGSRYLDVVIETPEAAEGDPTSD